MSLLPSVADAETDSMTAESGFEDQEITSAGIEVTRFVSRFVDKVPRPLLSMQQMEGRWTNWVI